MASSEARSRAFQKLKPSCVRLSECALKYRLGRVDGKELTSSVDDLRRTLQSTVDNLDTKLADYVFFPLSQVLQERQKTPLRTTELVLQCLQLLLQKGWRQDVNPDLALQLFILLTHLASAESVTKEKLNTSDEFQAVAFGSQTQLLKAIGQSKLAKELFRDTKYVPVLGHGITIMLEGARDGASVVQTAALDDLVSFFECFDDRDMLTIFFPGVVSALTLILNPTTQKKRHFRVLQKALIVLTDLLPRLLADTLIGVESKASTNTTLAVLSDKNGSWLTATAAQVKLALTNVVRLRHHDRNEVTDALATLCWTVLRQCRSSLYESAPIMLQVLVSLAEKSKKTREAIAEMLNTDVEMANTLRDNLYDWLLSLSRIMLSNDEDQKRSNIARIANAHSLLSETEVDMSMIDSIVHTTLVDSMTNTVQVSSKPNVLEQDHQLEYSTTAIINAEPSDTFDMVLTANRQTQETVLVLDRLVQQIASSNGALRIARESLDNARASGGDYRIINLWLSLNILRIRTSDELSQGFDDFIDMSPGLTLESDICEDLYSFAIELLSQEHDFSDQGWKQQALALEVLALQSKRLRNDFKTELVDALYPVVHLFASPILALRNHAMTCLNIIASCCGYANAKDLLVANVDYLVNAVGVKLNTFDLSPEAPQVLLMMIKLCGPVLLPYLEDLIDSIFNALECFHGYPTLVDMLFTVLKGVVEEGAKAPQFSITMGDKPSHRKPSVQPTTVSQVIAELRQRREKLSASVNVDEVEQELAENRRKARLPVNQNASENEPDRDDEDSNDDGEPAPVTLEPNPTPPLTKTYNILHRITELTQHHLPSSSPSIRASLISLLKIALPYLSRHDDTFLPMVHTLWPVLVPRLDDPEAYVVAGILDIMACICEGAGDFVSARIEGLWPTIRRIWKSTKAPYKDNARRREWNQADKKKPQSQNFTSQPQQQRLITGSRVSDSSSPHNDTERGFNMALSRTISSSNSKSNLTPLSSTSLLILGPPKVTSSSPATHTSSSHLTPASPSPINLISEPNSSSNYTPTTTTLLLTSLTTFLISLLHNTRIPEVIYREILTEMLYDALMEAKGEGRAGGLYSRHEEVKEALEARNRDAVWLVLERATATANGGLDRPRANMKSGGRERGETRDAVDGGLKGGSRKEWWGWKEKKMPGGRHASRFRSFTVV